MSPGDTEQASPARAVGLDLSRPMHASDGACTPLTARACLRLPLVKAADVGSVQLLVRAPAQLVVPAAHIDGVALDGQQQQGRLGAGPGGAGHAWGRASQGPTPPAGSRSVLRPRGPERAQRTFTRRLRASWSCGQRAAARRAGMPDTAPWEWCILPVTGGAGLGLCDGGLWPAACKRGRASLQQWSPARASTHQRTRLLTQHSLQATRDHECSLDPRWDPRGPHPRRPLAGPACACGSWPGPSPSGTRPLCPCRG